MLTKLVATSIAVAVLSTSAAMAATISGTTVIEVNDGSVVDGTRADGQSSFSNEFAISSDTTTYEGTTYSVGSIAIGDIPVVDGQFQFILDSQETGGSPTLSIEDIILIVGTTEIWNYDEVTFGSLDLDGSTASPRGNGADIGLYVDVTLFAGLTGADTLEFLWIETDDNNGAEEWVTVGDGFFGDDDVIEGVVTAVPLPAGGLLLLSGLGGLLAYNRRKALTA